MKDLIKSAAGLISKARNLVALTGAGISVESGIPPFRGKGGVWEKYDPMKYATIQAFTRNPREVWRVLLSELQKIVEKAVPNEAHKGLYELERMGILTTIITQNVDGLHQAAGNTDVIEFHGTFARHRCMACEKPIGAKSLNLDKIPPKCDCGGIVRPECIFFGELIPPSVLLRSHVASSECDIMLVVGTSAIVQPAANMPLIAKHAGAKVIEINPEPTPLTNRVCDLTLRGEGGTVMQRLLKELQLIRI
jgi:NAD-dependent deacetylase